MQFESWSEFWHMGGYGFFVWLSFAVTIVAMAALVIQTKLEAKALKKEALATAKRQTRIRQAMEVKK